MKTDDKLLAKSRYRGHEISLLDHTIHVMDAAEALFGTAAGPTRLGRCWLRFFQLNPDLWPRFHANLLAACALHDWGKANDGFQDEVRGKRGCQAIRHEHLSALLIGLPQVSKWLDSAVPKLDLPIVVSAVLTHHLKAAFDPSKLYGFGNAENRRNGFRLLVNGELPSLSAAIADRLRLPPLDLNEVPAIWDFDGTARPVRKMRDDLKKGVLGLLANVSRSDPRRKMLVAVRAALIAADAAGSGAIRRAHETNQEPSLVAWIAERFSAAKLLDENGIWEKVIDPRVNELKRLGRWRDAGDGKGGWTDFQLDAGDAEKLPARALLLAPCGSGKTLAAWRWIAARAAEQPVARVLFLYPTRATAKEGFKDYVSWAPDADAALMHGTAELIWKTCSTTNPTLATAGATKRNAACSRWRSGRSAFSRPPSISSSPSCSTATGRLAYCRYWPTP
jgi:CRISPR-associated endonuclease/helicase Cas3